MDVDQQQHQQQHVFRRGNSSTAVKLWKAIENLTELYSKEGHNLSSVANFCQKKFQLCPEDVTHQLEILVKDGLFTKTQSSAEKDEILYSIPVYLKDRKMPRGSHDWYCFECHKAGPMIKCSECYRVYHESCLKANYQEIQNFICSMCLLVSNATSYKLKKDLNKLLAFTCQRLRHSLPIDFTAWSPTDTELLKLTSSELDLVTKKSLFDRVIARLSKKDSDSSTWKTWMTQALLFEATDIYIMESRADRMVYRSLEQFQVDSLSVLHNVAILYGESSFITVKAKKMYEDCVYDINEIRLCHRCYRYSNFRESEDWFCEPCNPPHELVFAKYSSYPFWPAKVMKVTGDEYNVRFFGASHSRATVKKSNTRPITSDVAELVSKRTNAWKQAYEELLKYQNKLKECSPSSSDDSISSAEGQISPKRRKVARVMVPRFEIVSTALEVSTFKQEKIIPDADIKKEIQENEVVLALPANLETSPILLGSQKPKCCQQLEDELNAARLRNRELMIELEQQREQSRRQMEDIVVIHQQNISEVKKKQWCRVCEAEAIYHCCWNASYCSTTCQNADWLSGHKFRCSHGNRE